MAKFKVGDVVQLKSGGPAMTVEYAGTEITCVWFSETDKGMITFNHSFPEATLEIWTDASEKPIA